MFCNVYNPPKELLDAATNILCRKRPEHLDSVTARWIQRKFSDLRQASEEVVRTTLGNEQFPFLFDASKELSVSMDTEWTDALNISSPECTFSPLPLISLLKPDMSVGIYPRQGLSHQQLQVATMFQEKGRTFAHPDKRGDLFPGLVVKCKSVSTRGLRYVGTDQANLSMGTMLRAFQTMYHRIYNQDHFSIMKPRAFTIVFDQEVVTFSFE